MKQMHMEKLFLRLRIMTLGILHGEMVLLLHLQAIDLQVQIKTEITRYMLMILL